MKKGTTSLVLLVFVGHLLVAPFSHALFARTLDEAASTSAPDGPGAPLAEGGPQASVLGAEEAGSSGGDAGAAGVLQGAARWGFYSVAISGTLNLIRQTTDGKEGVDAGKAFGFLGDASFWGGTLASFASFLLASRVAAAFLPAGTAPFVTNLVRFMAASFGYEAGRVLAGGEPPTAGDLLKILPVTTLRVGAYTLAQTMIPGAPAPVLIAVAVAAGEAARWLINRLTDGPEAEAATAADLARDTGGRVESPNRPPVNPDGVVAGQRGDSGSPRAWVPRPSSPSTIEQRMREAYSEYIALLKERKVVRARQAYDRYVAAKETLDGLRRRHAGIAPLVATPPG